MVEERKLCEEEIELLRKRESAGEGSRPPRRDYAEYSYSMTVFIEKYMDNLQEYGVSADVIV